MLHYIEQTGLPYPNSQVMKERSSSIASLTIKRIQDSEIVRYHIRQELIKKMTDRCLMICYSFQGFITRNTGFGFQCHKLIGAATIAN